MKKLLGLVMLLGLGLAEMPIASASLITEMPPQIIPIQVPQAVPQIVPQAVSQPDPRPMPQADCDLTGFNYVTERSGTIAILPKSYNPQKQYPTLVVLPYTDSNACEFFDRVFRASYAQSKTPYIAILPAGVASRADYSTGERFEETIGRFETTIRTDLAALKSKYRIDGDRVSLAGFSFGADLGWALSVRNPGLFNGAFLIDSLCSYRADDNMGRLARGNQKFFLVAGEMAAGESEHPMADVKRLLDRNRISNVYEAFDDASHSEIIRAISPETYQEAFDYIMAEE
jgi:predicted esterase